MKYVTSFSWGIQLYLKMLIHSLFLYFVVVVVVMMMRLVLNDVLLDTWKEGLIKLGTEQTRIQIQLLIYNLITKDSNTNKNNNNM